MPGLGNKRQEIEVLKLRIETQRHELGDSARTLIPSTRAIATTGKSLLRLRPLMPILKPLALAVLPQLWAKHRARKLLIFGSLIGITLTGWRLLRVSQEKES